VLARDFCKAAPNLSSRRLFVASFLLFHRRRLIKMDLNSFAFKYRFRGIFLFYSLLHRAEGFASQGEAFLAGRHD